MTPRFTRDVTVDVTVPAKWPDAEATIVATRLRIETDRILDDVEIKDILTRAIADFVTRDEPKTSRLLAETVTDAASKNANKPWNVAVVAEPVSYTVHHDGVNHASVRRTAGKFISPVPVSPKTVTQRVKPTLDFTDETGNDIHVGDDVTLFDVPGRVVVEQAAAGIACEDGINWDELERRVTAATNTLNACRNDHFISLWELAWNLDACESGEIPGLRVVENKREK